MNNWNEFFEQEKKQEYFINLMQKVDEAYEKGVVYPPKDEMFSCFELAPYENIKVVIIGQDPYHGKNQAHGLCFSVRPEVKIPPSLKNIYKELHNDIGIKPPNHGYLISWAKQGVLMMNTSWSVEEGNPASHKKFGWEIFTKRVLEVLNNHEEPLVFILWGNHAIKVAENITNKKHLLLKSPHPSPLAGGGFFGTKPFSKANEFLRNAGREEIDWRISNIKNGENIEAQKSDSLQNIDTVSQNRVDSFGKILKVIDLSGIQTAIFLQDNKILFINPFTKEKIDEIFIFKNKQNKIEQIEVLKIDNRWHILYTLNNASTELKWNYCVAILNLETKKIDILQKTKARVIKFSAVYEKEKSFCFVVYELDSTLILKFNLFTCKEEERFEVPQSKEVNFHLFYKNNKPMLLVDYIIKDKSFYKLFEI